MIVMPQVLDEYSFSVTLFFSLSGHRRTVKWKTDAISLEQAERMIRRDCLDRYPGAVIDRIARNVTTYTVYTNEDGKAVKSGNVTAPTYAEAMQTVRERGLRDEDFMLVRGE